MDLVTHAIYNTIGDCGRAAVPSVRRCRLLGRSEPKRAGKRKGHRQNNNQLYLSWFKGGD